MLHPEVSSIEQAADAQRILDAIVESSEDGIITSTPAGIILTWNGGAEGIFGYSVQDAVGVQLSALVAPEELSRMEQLTKQVVEGSRVSRREIAGLRKDGSTILLSVTACPIRNAVGDIVTISVVLRDIHERKRTEERLEE